jgi:hypothetical protein
LQSRSWMASRKEMAAQLERLIKQMMSCNAKRVTIPSVFLTSAQSYAAAASLEPENELLTQQRLKAAAAYTRIANSYEPGNIQDWELFYFCPAVNNEKNDLVPVFRDEVLRPDGLQIENANILTNEIKTQCQKVRSPQQSPAIARMKP